MKKRILKGKKGFTLIELIVVIAILAVLAMLALPTFSGLIKESKTKVADANARTVYTAAKAYIALNSDDITGTTLTPSLLDEYLGNDFDTNTTSVEITLSDDKQVTKVTLKTDGADGEYPRD